jgi:hypothetical protein
MDIIPDEQPRPRWVALYKLGLLLRTVGGSVHPLAAYLDWLRDAGFEPPEQHRLVDQAQAHQHAVSLPQADLGKSRRWA